MFDKHPHQEGSDSGDLQLKYNMNVKAFKMENPSNKDDKGPQ